MNHRPLGTLPLPGIEALPSQPFGPLHLVPLMRTAPPVDLPLIPVARPWITDDDTHSGVVLVPHGAVTGFDGSAPLVAYSTQIVNAHNAERRVRTARMDYPIGRRDASSRVRMLPMHLSLEGALLSTFDASPETWARRSKVRVYDGSVRSERSAASVVESALRTFELHPAQCGALVYAADTLLAAFVAPSPEVYAELHRAIVGDLLGGTMQLYLSRHDAAERPFKLELGGAAIRTLDDLRLALARTRAPWPTAVSALREGLSKTPLVTRGSTRAQPYTVRRFSTGLTLDGGNALGEVVTRDDGAIAWLSFLRLSDAQTRRAYLLAELAAAGWSPETLAARRKGGAVDDTEKQLLNAGFEHVLAVMSPGRAKAPPQRKR